MKKLFFTPIFMFLLLCSCTTLHNSGLKSPDTIVCNIDEYQLISGKLPYMKEETNFEAWTVASENGVEITLFLPTGQTFCHTSWDGVNFTYESGFIENGQVFGKALINDFIDCYGREKTSGIIEINGNGYSYTVETL